VSAPRSKPGFFIPYRHAHDLPAAGGGEPYAALARLFDASAPDFSAFLGVIDGYGGALSRIGEDRPPAPRWEQDWFPALDAAAAYAMVRQRQPRRVIEIGSGHSTRFMARAVADGGLDCAITAIDPCPRAAIGGLPIQVVPKLYQDVGEGVFAALAAGDVLFVDSSHVLMPGSDVDGILNRVLPELPAGVLVHFHDIFLPDGYPPEWAWRGYNEQSAVAPLLHGGAYKPLFASHYVRTRLAAAVAAGIAGRLPLVAGARESSLWLLKQA
jgi:Methyltransferase domain